ncbi:TonB-dependent receptor [Kaistella anthropi]|nr:TonB-dependent receptor [Kaistella anthropi]
MAKLEVFFLKKFTNQLMYRYNERVSTGSYQILDEKLSYDAKNYNIYIMVNNILDTEYTETFGVPMPYGRWFHIGVSFKTGF